MIEIGKVCIKKAGHEANQKCVVVDSLDDNFVVVTGPRVKKRRCNVKHLEFLPHSVDLKKDAPDNEAINALMKAGIITKEDLPQKPVYTPKSRPGVAQTAPKKEAEKAKISEKILGKKKPEAKKETHKAKTKGK